MRKIYLLVVLLFLVCSLNCFGKMVKKTVTVEYEYNKKVGEDYIYVRVYIDNKKLSFVTVNCGTEGLRLIGRSKEIIIHHLWQAEYIVECIKDAMSQEEKEE